MTTANLEPRTEQTGDAGDAGEAQVARWVVVAVIAVLALFVLGFARGRVVAPFDDLVTEQICLRHGEVIERTLLDFERSNRFALRDRTDGYCSYGPGADGDPAIVKTVAETEPGALYRWAKVIGIILQLGIVSIFIRFVTDPALEMARVVARLFSRR